VAVLFLCAQFFTACSSSREITEARQQQQSLHDSLARLEASAKQSSHVLNDQSDRIGTLERRVQMQQAQIEALSAYLDSSSRKKLNLHNRKQAASMTSHATKQGAATGQSLKQTSITANPESGQIGEGEKNAYTAAYLALKSGRYDEASKAFIVQLKDFPQGEFADQAWYWLGESQYAQKNSKQAIQSFKQVIDKFPESVKHDAALLKLGQIYQTMNRPKEARKYFEKLIALHADSTTAEQARSALAGMKANSQTKAQGK